MMKKIATLIIGALLISLVSPLAGFENDIFYRKILEPYGLKMKQLSLDGDYEQLIEFYDESVTLMAPMEPPHHGPAAIRRDLQELKKNRHRYHSIDGKVLNVWGCGEDIYERGTFSVSFSTKDQPKPQAIYGSYFTIWRRQEDGSYKIKFTMWNLDYNPWHD